MDTARIISKLIARIEMLEEVVYGGARYKEEGIQTVQDVASDISRAPEPERLYTITEAAKIYGKPRKSIYRQFERGLLDYQEVDDGTRRVRGQDLIDLWGDPASRDIAQAYHEQFEGTF